MRSFAKAEMADEEDEDNFLFEVFCFCGEKECVEKKMKVRSLRVTFAQFSGRKRCDQNFR